jgi:large subunit ribosomal protein L23
MGLFSSKKKKEDVVEAKPVKKAAPKKNALMDVVNTVSSAPKKIVRMPVVSGMNDSLIRPRITEKAANMTAMSVYTFDIRKDATKKDVADAVKKLYKVTPIKIHVVNTPAKRVAMRKKRGFGKTTATRKAYVFLKKGEEISFT